MRGDTDGTTRKGARGSDRRPRLAGPESSGAQVKASTEPCPMRTGALPTPFLQVRDSFLTRMRQMNSGPCEHGIGKGELGSGSDPIGPGERRAAVAPSIYRWRFLADELGPVAHWEGRQGAGRLVRSAGQQAVMGPEARTALRKPGEGPAPRGHPAGVGLSRPRRRPRWRGRRALLRQPPSIRWARAGRRARAPGYRPSIRPG